jgi:hypothetical protein
MALCILAAAALACLNLLACNDKTPLPEQRELDELHEKARAVAQKNTERWRKVIEADSGSVEPRSNVGPCPIKLGDPLLAISDHVLGDMDMPGIDAEYRQPIAILERAKLASSLSPRGRMIESHFHATVCTPTDRSV